MVDETAAESPMAQSPIAQSPIAQSPIAQSPIAQSPIAQSPIAQSPIAQSPIARSPIAPALPVEVRSGWEVSAKRSSAALRLADLTPLTKVGVKGDHLPFEVGYGRTERRHEWLVVGSGPDEWTLLGPPGAKFDVRSDGFSTVIDLTHGRALVRLTGPSAPELLAKVCSIDLSDSMCPNGAAFRASVANVVADVVRWDRGPTRSFLLHCERSSGQFLFDALLDAGQEFGIDTDGFGEASSLVG